MADSEGALTCKVVLIGESGVGKTSIISRYMTNTFKSQLMSTPGANFVKKNVIMEDENKSINFEIWDTAGQERYRSLAKVFYKNATVCVLVYDITRNSSFEAIKNYWIKEIKENAPSDIIIALAGNKDDNYENEVVTLSEGKKLAEEINGIFKSTSAMLSHGIDDLFKTIGEKFINPSINLNEPSISSKEDKFRKGVKLRKQQLKNEKEPKKCC